MFIWGHRGSHGPDGPGENTLAAFARAVDEDADGVELDVRRSADGEAMVLHDPDLARLTGGADRRPVGEVSAAELARLAGAPTLAEVFAALPAVFPVNVEVKAPDGVEPTVAVLRDVDPARLVLSSFVPEALAALGRLLPDVPRALLLDSGSVGRPSRAAIDAGLDHLGADRLHVDSPLADPELIAHLHARGAQLHVWTVNAPEMAKTLAARGVDGVFTDHPGALRAALEIPRNKAPR